MIYAVLDTNLIVSASLSPKLPLGQIMKTWEDGLFHPCLSEPVFSEIRQVLSRPCLAKKHHISPETRAKLLRQLLSFSNFVLNLPKLKPVINEDPADDILIATGLAARAKVIVSEDNHLQKLKEYPRIILSPKDW